MSRTYIRGGGYSLLRTQKGGHGTNIALHRISERRSEA